MLTLTLGHIYLSVDVEVFAIALPLMLSSEVLVNAVWK